MNQYLQTFSLDDLNDHHSNIGQPRKKEDQFL